MRLDDGARDRQADAHALTLGGDERLEQLRADLRRDAGPGIGNADLDHIVRRRRRGDDEFALSASSSIASMALRIRLSRTCWIWTLSASTKSTCGVEIEAHAHALVLGADQSQRACLLDQLLDVLDAPLALAARDEIAQAADDLARAQRLLGRLVHGVAQEARRARRNGLPAAGAIPSCSWRSPTSGWLSSCASADAISPMAVSRDMCTSSACSSCSRASVCWRSVRSRMKPVKKRCSPHVHLADGELHGKRRAVPALADDDAADADDAPLAGAHVAIEIAVVLSAIWRRHQHLDVLAR